MSVDRESKIRQVVTAVAERLSNGLGVDVDRLLADHPDLRPELEEELRLQEITHREFLAAQRAGPFGPAGVKIAGGDEPEISVQGYRVLGEIARGGQATVYRAVQFSTGRTVALKVLAGGAIFTRRRQARLDLEAGILAHLQHQNIVGILDRGRTSDGSSYLAMEFVEGSDLDEWVAPQLDPAAPASAAPPARRTVAEILAIFIKICRAVGVAHHQKIVHRDLKPSNVRVDSAGEPYLLDFGLARILAEEGAPAAARTTLTGQVVGSLPWLSPEQAGGVVIDVDARSDVYSLGVMLYESLTGRPPYSRDGTLSEVLSRVENQVPAAPSRHRPEIGRSLDAAILKALAKKPQDRFADAAELAAALEQCARDPALADPRLVPRSDDPRSRSRMTAVAVVCVASLAAFAFWPRSPSPGPAGPLATPSTAVTAPSTAVSATAFARDVIALRPVANAFVRDGEYADRRMSWQRPNETGVYRQLECKTIAGLIGYNRDSYLLFDLGALPPRQPITRAILHLHGTALPGGKTDPNAVLPIRVGAFALEDPAAVWDASALTWNNRPFIRGWDNAKTAKATVQLWSKRKGWYDLDLTEFVKAERAAGRTRLSIGLHVTDSSDLYATFDAKDGEDPPTLEVVTERAGEGK